MWACVRVDADPNGRRIVRKDNEYTNEWGDTLQDLIDQVSHDQIWLIVVDCDSLVVFGSPWDSQEIWVKT
jgi:hypothetical protein